MATEEVHIPIRVTGAKKAADQLRNMGQGAKKADKSVTGLKRALQTLIAAEATRRIFEMGVAFQSLDRRLRAVSDTSEELATNLALVTRASRNTRSDISTNANTFQRLRIAMESTGGTAEETARVLETLNKSLAIGGATANEARNALLQLGQGLASGNLQGDELRTLRESASFLSQILAKKLGVDGVGALKALGAEGKLTTDVLIKAFLEAGDEVDAKFKELPETLSEALASLKTEFVLLAESLGPALKTIGDGLGRIGKTVRIINRAVEKRQLRKELEALVLSSRARIEAAKDKERAANIEIANNLRTIESIKNMVAAQAELKGAALPETLEVLDQFQKKLEKADEESKKQLKTWRDDIPAGIEAAADAIRRFNNETAFQNVTGDASVEGDPGVTQAEVDAQDPLLLAIEQARVASLVRQEQAVVDSNARINALAQEAFEKDLARFELLEDALTTVFSGLTDAWVDFLRTGEFSFEEFASSILGNLADILAQALITQAVTALLGPAPGAPGVVSGLGASGIPLALDFLGPGKAAGGPVEPGRAFPVGERGIEMFVPTASGRIEPNGSGGGAQPINLTVINQMGKEEFTKVIDDRLESPDGAAKTLGGLNKKKTQAKRLLS